jgi:hypothetical protein
MTKPGRQVHPKTIAERARELSKIYQKLTFGDQLER